ncbi:MAG TPA: hypothetical protein VNH63_09290 [Gemmatimonadales bacterium]|nr:hypothetical protein [Gemmatimonadales bacterium]
MHRRLLVSLSVLALLVLGCSDTDTHVLPAAVNWMEWPAEVRAGAAFNVRLVGFAPFCGPSDGFSGAPQVSDSAVTFQPYFIVPDHPSACPLTVRQATSPILAPSFDTTQAVPGLPAPSARSYDIRASLAVATPGGSAFVIRTFGTVIVRADSADTSRTAAAGQAYTSRDTLSCLRILTPGLFFPGYVVENPPDTTTYWSAFVLGYVYTPAAPVCGEKRVFHLVARQ